MEAVEQEDPEPETQFLLVRRFRSVAFAALGAGISEADLHAALAVAVAADRRRTAWSERRQHLRIVPAPAGQNGGSSANVEPPARDVSALAGPAAAHGSSQPPPLP
jgi:hypothetical protein